VHSSISIYLLISIYIWSHFSLGSNYYIKYNYTANIQVICMIISNVIVRIRP